MKLELFVKRGDSESNSLLKIVEELEQRFAGRLEVKVYGEEVPLAREYRIRFLPCVVVNEMIKIQGVCPSKETIIKALYELGFETDVP